MTRALVAACSFVLVLAAASGASVSVVPGGNLIQNPGAESVTSTGTPAGWTLDGSFTAAAYGIDLPKAESTRIDGGTYYFFGGHGAGGHARQTIDVSSSASEIDGGTVQATLSALIGGYTSQSDPGTVAAVFRNGAGADLKTLTIGPVTPADRDNVSKLLSRSATQVVRSGTRSIEIVLTATRESGGDSDSYFDNLSLTLEKETEAPSTASAKDPIVGLWKTSGNSRIYRWAAIKGGYEERSMTPHRTKRGCLVAAGDPVYRYIWNGVKGSKTYRVTPRYWNVKTCSARWGAPEETVMIVLTGRQLKLSCDKQPNKVCNTYTRVGS